MDCKPKLLYAEDNRLTAKEMTEILEEEGYEVVTTYSGDEAWETFERISPDLVLLDFRMPGLNGLEVFERIRQVDAEIPGPTDLLPALWLLLRRMRWLRSSTR